jgi:hypothetical protein
MNTPRIHIVRIIATRITLPMLVTVLAIVIVACNDKPKDVTAQEPFALTDTMLHAIDTAAVRQDSLRSEKLLWIIIN